MNLPNLD